LRPCFPELPILLTAGATAVDNDEVATPVAGEDLIHGRFRRVAIAGRGSFGRVLEVIDTQTGESRALKIIPRGPHESTLLDEFEQLARLRHPSLPRVFEVGRTVHAIDDIEPGAAFFVAEWIAGTRSDARAWSGAAAVWSLLADVAGALATIHAAGIVHADVAPQNVLVTRDRAVLVDLGLAGVAATARGTPSYMAPEALAGHLEPRSDLYGLGATVVRLLAGRPPFEGATLGELVQRIVVGRAAPALPGVPRPLVDLIGRLMHRDLEARPASALAVLDELDQLAPAIDVSTKRIARPKVGAPPAPASWPGATTWIAELDQALSTPQPIIVVGSIASGARQLVDAALRRRQLDDVAQGLSVPLIAGELDAAASQLGVEPFAIPSRDATRAQVERVAQAAHAANARIVFELGADPRAVDLISALARGLGSHPVIAIVDVLPAQLERRRDLLVLAVPALDEAGVAALAASMLRTRPPAAWTQALHAASDGLPLTVIELLRSIVEERDPLAVDWSDRAATGVVELRTRSLRGASRGAQCVATAIAVWGGRARLDRVLATARAANPDISIWLSEVVELERLGVAHRLRTTAFDGEVIEEVTIDRNTREAALAVAGPDAVVAMADAALACQPLAGDDAAPIATTLAEDSRPARVYRAVPKLSTDEIAAIDRDGQSGQRRTTSRGIGVPQRATSTRIDLASPLEHAELEGDHADLACEVAEQLLARGQNDRALALARRAIAVAPARAGMIAARAAGVLGAYKEVAALARDAVAAGADVIDAELVIARAAQRAAALDEAEAVLAQLHAAHPTHAEVAGTYARLLVTRSRYADARRVATGESLGPLTGLRAEAAGLAAFYLGELAEADAAFAALELGATAANDPATIGRALSLRGMVAQQRGQLGLASDRYQDAARRLHEVGELHAAAVAELNLGTVLAERGRASDALPRLAAASRVFADLGATTELIAADLNRGNALLALGQLEDARVAAETAIARADGAPHLRAFALLVAGDARRRLGDEPGAVGLYREALAIGAERGDAHAQISAHVALAEAGQRVAVDADVEALCASQDDRDRWTIARGRLAVRESGRGTGSQPSISSWPDRGSGSHAAITDTTRRSGSVAALTDPAAPLARACSEVGARAADGDRIERAFRAHAVASRLAARANDHAFARAEGERARAAHAALTSYAAPAFRAALEADPDLAQLPAAAMPGAQPSAREMPLRRLLTLSRRLNSEASVERILDEVIDTAIELSNAERGFLLLRQADGELAPVVSRNFLAAELEGGGVVSRSIAERAAQTGEPVMTVDAGVDERFGAAASVAALRLRSVLVVPLRQRGAIIGCIYVDHRLRGGAFDEIAASVLGELADIAAIAIDNARLTTDLRKTSAEVDQLNARLSAELADKDAELTRVKAELPDRDRLRHRYERIVGRSAATVRMLDLVDRAAATALPVVIVGESGTGKELVARALHDNGPRKDGPFVAINCSAVPEPLLESELFGHIRGSFTGADRDRRGLFEVADGGTLFLDEVADTSAAMQAKLLRVLQDGSVRRVGDTKTRQVNVRVIAATQHPLAELVTQGRFREDLRFRIEVIAVMVPALRERDGDIPLLVERLLALLCGDKPAPRLTRAALRALGAHRWPGNIRELENALARGVAMGSDVIDVGDLPEAVANAAGRPEPAKPVIGDDLRLKPALTATEQAYISAAMSRAKNNQTVAARLLGLSRFGLQKKLRRLSGEAAADDDDA
jgi:transcriptional regulator with GAF, ATPase, and Fis domain